jgi:hypothetical protein
MDKMDAFASAYLSAYRTQPLDILDEGGAAIGQSATYRDIFGQAPWRYLGLDIEAAPNVDLAVKVPTIGRRSRISRTTSWCRARHSSTSNSSGSPS